MEGAICSLGSEVAPFLYWGAGFLVPDLRLDPKPDELGAGGAMAIYRRKWDFLRSGAESYEVVEGAIRTKSMYGRYPEIALQPLDEYTRMSRHGDTVIVTAHSQETVYSSVKEAGAFVAEIRAELHRLHPERYPSG